MASPKISFVIALESLAAATAMMAMMATTIISSIIVNPLARLMLDLFITHPMFPVWTAW